MRAQVVGLRGIGARGFRPERGTRGGFDSVIQEIQFGRGGEGPCGIAGCGPDGKPRFGTREEPRPVSLIEIPLTSAEPCCSSCGAGGNCSGRSAMDRALVRGMTFAKRNPWPIAGAIGGLMLTRGIGGLAIGLAIGLAVQRFQRTRPA